MRCELLQCQFFFGIGSYTYNSRTEINRELCISLFTENKKHIMFNVCFHARMR